MYKKPLRLFKRGYMINDNENEAENKKIRLYRYNIKRRRPRRGY